MCLVLAQALIYFVRLLNEEIEEAKRLKKGKSFFVMSLKNLRLSDSLHYSLGLLVV